MPFGALKPGSFLGMDRAIAPQVAKQTMPFGALKQLAFPLKLPHTTGTVAMKTMPFGEGKTKHKERLGSGTKNKRVKLAA
jgi:hypothetical protein